MRELNHTPLLAKGLIVRGLFLALVFWLFAGPLVGTAFAQEVPEKKYTVGEAIEIISSKVEEKQLNIDTVWTIVGGVLVMFMQAGFMMLEVGFARTKNIINVIMKIFLGNAVSTTVFFLVGFGFMAGMNSPSDPWGIIGTSHFSIGPNSISLSDEHSWTWTYWFFQVVFCAVSCVIVSGALAERTRFRAYLIYCVVFAAVIYPVVGHWAWGGAYKEVGAAGTGWLARMGFIDFAGSSVVHVTGGACSLAGILIVGPRINRFAADGSARLIVGHNIPLAALGTFMLWFSWFGFNAGSTLVGDGSIGRIVVTTHLAACAGALTAMVAMWLSQGRSDIGTALNGSLAGLVAITAGCATATPLYALFIGGVAGVLATFGAILLEMLKLDDPVGAVPVHMVGGLWGTVAEGFAPLASGKEFYWWAPAGKVVPSFGVQCLGTASIFTFSLVCGLILFTILKYTVGLRVTDTEQLEGLDFHEHAATAYPEFETTEQNV